MSTEEPIKGSSKLSDVVADCVTVFVFLLASTGLLLPLLRAPSSTGLNASAGDPVTQVIWLGVYLVISMIFLVQWRWLLSVALRDKLLLLLTCLAPFSVLWSAAPEVTVRRSVGLVGTYMFGIYLARRYRPEKLLQLLAWALGIIALLSLVFALALPSYGISHDPLTPGDWQGVFSQKNTLGKNMALGAIVFLLLALGGRRFRWVAFSGLGLSVALLFLSDSATALVVTLGIVLLLPLYRTLQWDVRVAMPLLLLALLTIGAMSTWLLTNADAALAVFGKDATLTGRTVLWSAVSDAIRERPWTGYGYSAFWLGLEGRSATIWVITGEEFYDAHNGILDLWLTLGFVGVVLFVLNFLRAVLQAVARAHTTGTVTELWPLAFLTFMLLSNLTESSILQQNNLSWILYVVTVLQLSVPQEVQSQERGIPPMMSRKP